MPSRRKKDLGLFLSQDRPKALDLAIASARAHNRMMADFCQVDRRLLATGYVPVFIIAHSSLLDEFGEFGLYVGNSLIYALLI